MRRPSLPAALPDPTRSSSSNAAALVRARRHARVAASVTLLVGFALLPLDALGLVFVSADLALVSTWIAAVTIYALAYLASLVASRRQGSLYIRSAVGPRSASEQLGVVVPAVALAFVTPLSLHCVVATLLGCGPTLHSFDDWVAASLLLVGHAHLALAFLVGRDARRLALDRPEGSARRTVWLTTAVAAIPGIMLLVPPLLVFVTGLAFVGFLYGWMRDVVPRERAILASS